ncbi:MAG: lytic murein transglycosylase [Candidatus Taylorbacteria bacterium]
MNIERLSVSKLAISFFGAIFLSLVIISQADIAQAQTIKCDTATENAACKAAYNQALADQAAAQRQLEVAQGQSVSFTQAIAVLAAKIKVAQLDIKSKNLLIQTLGNDIQVKSKHIDDLKIRIEKGKQTLADILRKTDEIDSYNLSEVLLSQSTLSGFFQDMDSFSSIRESLQTVFDELRDDQASTTAEKDALTERQNKELDARYAIQQQEKKIQYDQVEQRSLLALSKQKEKTYASVVAEKAAQAAKIRAALFPLAGSQKIPFGTALQYAEEASTKTGVRPAFLLAILTNESALGADVGQCYLSNVQTGEGIKVSTGKLSPNVMKPTRDVGPFLDITKSLGLDPLRTVVSCQQPSVGGWGGAMGPAQFIASTWVSFVDRIKMMLSVSGTPSPWNAEHAFMASALYLSDLGAGRGGYTAERNAACRYYSGRYCSESNKIASYGDNAIRQATVIQNNIDLL